MKPRALLMKVYDGDRVTLLKPPVCWDQMCGQCRGVVRATVLAVR